MKIVDIEAIALRVPYEERIRKAFYHFAMTEELTLYKFHTDTGLIGLGERVGPPLNRRTWSPIWAATPLITSWALGHSTSIWPATT